uniref:Uncharacterized protein n=1 Tax=Arundo donax TaxID=35708 RepID=A0A0A9A0H9_ARUDO
MYHLWLSPQWWFPMVLPPNPPPAVLLRPSLMAILLARAAIHSVSFIPRGASVVCAVGRDQQSAASRSDLTAV